MKKITYPVKVQWGDTDQPGSSFLQIFINGWMKQPIIFFSKSAILRLSSMKKRKLLIPFWKQTAALNPRYFGDEVTMISCVTGSKQARF